MRRSGARSLSATGFLRAFSRVSALRSTFLDLTAAGQNLSLIQESRTRAKQVGQKTSFGTARMTPM